MKKKGAKAAVKGNLKVLTLIYIKKSTFQAGFKALNLELRGEE